MSDFTKTSSDSTEFKTIKKIISKLISENEIFAAIKIYEACEKNSILSEKELNNLKKHFVSFFSVFENREIDKYVHILKECLDKKIIKVDHLIINSGIIIPLSKLKLIFENFDEANSDYSLEHRFGKYQIDLIKKKIETLKFRNNDSSKIKKYLQDYLKILDEFNVHYDKNII